MTRNSVVQVLREQGEDPRALFLVWGLDHGSWSSFDLLHRAAEMGYAPAQAYLSMKASLPPEEIFCFASSASSQGDRDGLFQLAQCYLDGVGCAMDRGKAKQLLQEAIALKHRGACFLFGREAFGEFDWERYHWWAVALSRGFCCPIMAYGILGCLPSFERGENGRILHVLAPVLAKYMLVVASPGLFDTGRHLDNVRSFQRMIALHEAMLRRARPAIHCWSGVGMRCGLVKDVRVMIAKMLWEEPWRWGEPPTNTVSDN
jgi:hypothetical protein